VLFEVEQLLKVKGHALVVARRLAAGDFVLGDAPRLAGVPIHRELTQPRALSPSGEPRLDLFAFRLKFAADIDRFTAGQRVELESDEAC
jgi:hypothetical protein